MSREKIAGLAVLTFIIALGTFLLGRQLADKPAVVNDFNSCVKAGYPVLESYPRQCKTPDGASFIEVINKNDLSDMIVVDSPKPNQVISSPLMVTGKARGNWYFEASFPVQLVGADGKVIAQTPAQAKGEWMTTDFVPFEAKLEFKGNFSGQTLMLVLMKDNPSGLPQYDAQIEIPVKVLAEANSEVKAFFSNNSLDKEITCLKVFPVNRQVDKTVAVARAALEELLKGPTAEEKAQGYFTSINSGVKIQKLTIEEGIAKADFNSRLEFQVGGSCRVSAIREQITETLKQFSTIKGVIISINGRTEDILQP